MMNTETFAVQAPSVPAALRSFNPEAFRISPEGLTSGRGAEILSRVPVKKPTRQEHFRVLDRPEMMLTTALFEDKEDRETYLVTPEMREHMEGDLTPAVLVTTVNRQGTVCIWPVKIPTDTDKVSGWHETARQAAELAKTKWVRMAADMPLGAYRIYQAEGDLPDPEWPEKSFGELLEVAFKGKVIDHENHPVIQKLRGRV